MAKVKDMTVLAVTWKGKDPGSKNWASVYDTMSREEAIQWIAEKKASIRHAAITNEGDFKTYQEVDLFKSMLKGMLNLEGGYGGNEKEREWFSDIEMGMEHFFENEIKNM